MKQKNIKQRCGFFYMLLALQPLLYSKQLEKAAMLRSTELDSLFSHRRPNGEWFY